MCSDTSYPQTEKDNKKDINFLNTNARPLCPKIVSLLDYFEELKLTFATITETRLADGKSLEEDLQDLALGSGVSMLCRNRVVNGKPSGHGGVALAFRNNVSDFKKIGLPNPDNFEILPAIGNIHGHSRKMVIITCYIPPNKLHCWEGKGMLRTPDWPNN